MNECQRKLNMIIDVVISACDTSLTLEGKKEVLKKKVFSKSKTEDAVRARTLLVVALKKYGYTNGLTFSRVKPSIEISSPKRRHMRLSLNSKTPTVRRERSGLMPR